MPSSGSPERAVEVSAMRWATRRHCHVDRAACAWLVARFIDPDAAFVFVDDPDDVPDDATPFDMRGVELGHHHDRCSFESFLVALRPRRARARWTSAGSCTRPTSATTSTTRRRRPVSTRLIRGISLVACDDNELLALTRPMFDGLYELLRRSHLHEGPSDERRRPAADRPASAADDPAPGAVKPSEAEAFWFWLKLG